MSYVLEPTHIDALPNELVRHVLSFLTYKERIKSETVCKKWYEIFHKNHWPLSIELSVDIFDNQPAEYIENHMFISHNDRNPDDQTELLPIQGRYLPIIKLDIFIN